MKLAPQKQLGPDWVRSSFTVSKARPGGLFSRFARAAQLKLVASGWGRIVLHLIVALKAGRYVWHLHGIAREFMRS
jgi:hypothetical protein